MIRHLLAVVVGVGILFTRSTVVPAGDVAKVYGGPPRIVIASKIDADGNLFLSALESRQKKVAREVERNGKKIIAEGILTYPVAVLNRQTVSLKGATIYDREGKVISLEQARERLKEPTPVL